MENVSYNAKEQWWVLLLHVHMLMLGAIHEWADFVHPLIGVNPDLKFSVEYDHKFVSFLDMWAE